MNDFWSKKRQELQQKGELPQARPEPVPHFSGPWWAHDTSNIPKHADTGYREPEAALNDLGGHDVSKAMHIKASGVCPMCGAGGTGKEKLPGLMKPSAIALTRCMSCGYSEGRQLNDPAMTTGITVRDIPTLKVRQTADGGALSDRTHMGASVADMAYNSSVLEQSFTGRVAIDNDVRNG